MITLIEAGLHRLLTAIGWVSLNIGRASLGLLAAKTSMSTLGSAQQVLKSTQKYTKVLKGTQPGCIPNCRLCRICHRFVNQINNVPPVAT